MARILGLVESPSPAMKKKAVRTAGGKKMATSVLAAAEAEALAGLRERREAGERAAQRTGEARM